jgi:transcriptional regulator with XRE-family HTH domain
MTPEEFRAWRERMKLTPQEAADALGQTPRSVAYFEAGGRKVSKTVEKLCECLEKRRRK